MATIVILEHGMQRGCGMPYMVYTFTERWRADGHQVLIHYGAEAPPPGDIAILNVDATVTPPEYRALLSRYRRVINGSVLDISKRSYSQLLLTRESDWPGPVIVKTNANFGGLVDQYIRQEERKLGLPHSVAASPLLRDYPVYASLREVPAESWADPGLVVERFMPERSGDLYYLRMWIFMGSAERNTRYGATDPLVKAANIGEPEMLPVPDELRLWRMRLGFDFGKFDYVYSGGRYWLLDANRTPALPPALLQRPGLREAYWGMAAGLYDFLR